ncbi:MAG: hypothetical protein QOD81_4261 [Solirubrobacteraceae bacterium]|jgi:hypothetical protein|nr:hypothetical protein [Solirubrobacteraceae bacterium]
MSRGVLWQAAMTVPWEGPPRSEPPFPPQKADVSLLSRIEGLVGEEDALLLIPAKDRSAHEHDRLRSIGGELDRIWDTLRRRAQRLEAHAQGGH